MAAGGELEVERYANAGLEIAEREGLVRSARLVPTAGGKSHTSTKVITLEAGKK